MERYEGAQEQQYRKVSYYDGNGTKYIIEKNKEGKWKYCFGGISNKEANHLLNNPSLIESQMKSFRITGYCVLVLIAILALFFMFQ